MRSGIFYSKLITAGKKVKGTSLLRVLVLAGILLFNMPAFAQTNWYSNGTGNADDLASWGINPDGSGANPSSFGTPGDTWNMITSLTSASTGTWTVAGTLNVGAGASGVAFTPQFGTINVGGDLNVSDDADFSPTNTGNTDINVTGNLSVTGTAVFDNGAAYNFIHFSNTGSSFGSPQTSTWSSGGTSFSTDFVVDASCYVQLLSDLPMSQLPLVGMTVNGKLICDNFAVNDPWSSSGFVLNSGASIYTGNSGGLNASVSGFVTNTFSQTANYIYNGTSGQVTGSFLPNIMTPGSLTINNSAGVSLSQGLIVSTGTLTLTLGKLILGSNTLTLGTASTLAGSFSGSAMIVTNSTGQVKKMLNSVGSFLYPVGDNSGNYTPITLNFTAASFSAGFASIKVAAAKDPHNANATDYLNRYWTLTSGGITSATYNVTAVYVPGDVNAGGTEANISMGKYPNALPWVKYSVTNTGTHTLTATGVTSATSPAAEYSGITTAAPTVSTSGDVTICSGGNTALSASGSGDPTLKYTWSPSTALSATTGTPVTATPTVTTTYTITVTDGNGFKGTATAQVSVNPLPATITGTTNVCVSATTTLSNASGGGTWSSSNTSFATVNSTSGDVTGIGAGTATITYTLPTGCYRTSPFTVNARPTITFSMEPAASSCVGSIVTYTTQSTQTNYIWMVPGSPGTDYVITGGGTGTSSSSVSLYWQTIGNQTVTVNYTDSHGCTGASVASNTTSVNTTPSISGGSDVTICSGNSTVLTASGGTTYTWSPATALSATTGVSVTANPTTTTTYTVTGTVVSGCSNTAIVTVSVNASPTVSGGSDVAICTGSSTGLTATGATTYTWSPSTALSATTGASVTANPTTAITYSVTGSNGGCSNTATVTVSVNPLPTISGGSDITICNGTSTVLTASGGATYTWSPATALSATTGVSVTANPTSTITYTVTGTDGNGCVNTASVMVSVNPLPTISGGSDVTICNGTSTILTASGGATYTWDPATALSATTGTSVTANPTSTITYTVTGTDGNGCVNTASVMVSVNPLPTISGGSDVTICNGTSTVLTASGGATYTWSPATALSATTGASVTANPTSTITYTVTGTDGNGCVNTASVMVSVNPLPTISGGSDVTICNGTSTVLTASGGATYTWSPATALSATTGTSVTANPTSTITYTVTGTDGNGCVNTASVMVSVNPLPAISGGSDVTICNGTSTVLTASGGATYTWSPATALSATTGTSVTANPTSTITYTVTGTDGNGCVNTASVMVSVNPLPTISGGSDVTICNGTSTILTASGGATYTWDPATALSATTGTSVTANPTSTITYTVTGTDGNGCVNTASVMVSVNPLPTISGGSDVTICNGTSTVLTASGGATYTWSPATALSATTGASVTANPTSTITYTVTGTDGNGCVNTASVMVSVNPLPTISGGSDVTICNGTSTVLTASGGATYTWSPATALSATTGTSVTANPTSTITYTVTGTDGNGCVNTASVMVSVNPLPAISGGSDVTICNGTSTGLTASGGATYTWSPATALSATTGTSVTANPTSTITYTVTGTDGNGCVNTASVMVSVNPLPTISGGSDVTICNGTSTVLTASGGATYTWDPATALSATTGASVTANPTSTITYTVTGTDGNGCVNTASVMVSVNPLPAISGGSDVTICNGTSTVLTASGGATYTWDPATALSATTGVSVTANPTSTITYTVTGTDGNGCVNTASVMVSVNPLPAISGGSDVTICNGTSTVLTASGGATYTWSPATALSATTGTSVTANPTSTITYTVTGTDGNGCVNTASVMVSVNPLPTISGGSDVTICNGTSTVLTASGGATYTWSPATALSATTGVSVTANPTSTITYTVTGTDGNGCVNTASVMVSVNPLPTISGGSDVTICNGTSTVLTASGGATYTWSPATALSATTGTSVTANPTSTITYTVTGTDGNGCVNTASVMVSVNPLPTISGGSDVTICNGTSTVLTASGGATYTWSPATALSATTGASVTANPTSTITYTVTGTDGSGCVNTASIMVSVNPLPVVTFTATPTSPQCSSTDVTYSTQGGESGYVWTFTGAPGSSYTITSGGTSADNTVTLQWLTAGSKTVTVNYTDAVTGCTATSAASNTITVNARPTPSFIGPPGANTCAGTTVQYRTQSTVGISNYIWNVPGTLGHDYTVSLGGTTTSDFFVRLAWLTTGSQTVTVNYTQNGCTGLTPATNTTSVNPIPVPTFTVSPGANSCTGTAATYSTEGGQTNYVWTTPGATVGIDYTIASGSLSTSSNTVSLLWITTGPQTVRVNYTGPSGCTGASPASSTTTVYDPPVPTFSSAPGGTICAGTITTYETDAGQNNYVWHVDGTPGTDYTITGGGTSSTDYSVSLFWMTPGSQTVTVNYDDPTSGCTGLSAASSTTTVNARPVPTFTVSPGANSCLNSSVTYSTEGGQTSYVWTVPGVYTISSGGISGSDNTVTLAWTTTGSKTVTVNYTDANGCTGASDATNTTTVNPLPVPTFTVAPTGTLCVGSSATYSTESGQSGYSWSVPGSPITDYNITAGGTTSSDNTVTLTWLTPGSKTVSVNYTDANGCTGAGPASNTTTVNSRPTPSFITAPGATNCVGGSVTYTTQSGGGISSYVWHVDGTLGSDYSIVSGGTSSTDNTVTLTWLTTGSKNVTVNYSDVSLCTGASAASNTTTINPVPTSTGATNDGPLCAGGTVALQSNSSDATAWSWTGPGGFVSSAQDPTDNPAGTGTYSLTISSTGVGCSPATVYTTLVSVNPVPSATPTDDGPICLGGTVNLTANAADGVGTYIYSWSGPGITGSTSTATTTAVPTSTGSTVYSVTVTNTASGCSSGTSYTTSVSVNAVPSATPTDDGPICIDGTVNLTANATGGVGAYIYSWSGTGITGSTSTATTTAVPTSIGSTVYSVTVTNTAAGCNSGTPYTTSVSVNAVPSAAPTDDGPICLDGTVNLTANATGGVGTYIYTWTGTGITGSTSTATTTAVPTSTGSTVYSVTVTNAAAGCNSGVAYTTSVSVNPVPAAAPTNDGPICVGSTVTLFANSTDASVWSWTGPGGFSSAAQNPTDAPATSGVYSLTVSSGGTSGCSPATVYTTSVTVNTYPVVAAITGNTTLSTAITTTLSDVTGGGVWESGTPLVATVGSSDGVVTGVTLGTGLISYTVSGIGCSTTVTTNVTVNEPTVGLNFDGTDDYVDVSANTNIPVGNSEYTIEAWIKPTSSAYGIVGWGDYGTTNSVNAFRLDGPNNLVNYWWDNDLEVFVPDLADGNWHHVAATFDGTTRKIYSDGILRGQDNPSGHSVPFANNMTLGETLSGEFFAGTMDELRIWNTALSQATIQANMNCDVPQQANLVAYYRFEDGIAGGTNTGIVNATDYSGNGNCGTLTNFALTGGASNYETGAVGNCNVITIPASAPTNNSPICNGGTVTLTAHESGGATGYAWTGPGFSSASPNPTATPTTSATYSLTVSSGSGFGCMTTTSVSVNPTPTAAPTNDGPVCAGGTVNLTSVSSDATEWTWVGSDGFTSTLQDPTATPSVTTTYSLTVSSGAAPGCSPSAVYTTTVDVSPVPTAAPTNSGPICDGGSATLNANATGGTGVLIYSWSGPGFTSGSANPTVTPTITTTYSLTVSSTGAGCNPGTVYMTTVSVNPVPSATPTDDGPICLGGTINLTANATDGVGTYIYTWSGPGITGSTSTATTTAVPTSTGSTVYSVTVTNTASGCSSGMAYTTSVSVNAVPSAVPTDDGPLCLGGTVNLTANATGGVGAYIYTWSGTGITGSTSTATTTAVPTSIGSTVYSVTVTNTASGCNSGTAYTTSVSVNAVPSATPTDDGPICLGGTVNLTANATGGVGAYIYTWSGTGITGSTSTATTTAVPTSIGSTVYSVTVTNTASGCNSGTAYTTSVSVNAVPSAIPTDDGPICLSGTVNLTANATGGVGAYIYTWSGTGITGSTSTATTTAVPTSTGSTVYSVTITNAAAGCNSGTAYTTSVSVNAVPSATPTDDGPICLGGTVNLTANAIGGVGTYIYTWSGTGITGSTSTATTTAVPASTGSTVYSVTVTNAASGCNSGTAYTTSVSVNAVPSATPTDDGPICLGGTVNLTANATGGVGAYTYSWSGPGITGSTSTAATTAVPTSTGSTVYSVTVTNTASGCNSGTAYTTSVSVNAVPSATPTDDGPICLSGTVNLTANATGGVPPYIYTWSGTGITGSTSTATTTAVPTSIGSTVYSVTVTNTASGCNSGTAYTTSVSVNPVPSATPTDDGPLCLGGTVNLTANATGGVPPYIYLWTGTNITGSTTTASTTAVPTSSGTTVYSVAVTNAASGCNSGSVYTTTVNVTPVPVAAPTNDGPLCLDGTVNLTANATGGVGAYTYTWSGTNITGSTSTATTTAVPTVTGSTVYTVTVFNAASGCSSLPYTTSVSVNPVPTAAPTNSGPSCLGTTVTLDANATDGVGAYIYTWTGSGITGSTSTATTTAVPPTTGSTVYSVTVTNAAAGCSSGIAYTTSVSVNPVPVASPTNDGPICIGGTVNLGANPSGTVTTYAWTGLSFVTSTSIPTPSATPTVTNIYSLTVTDGSGYPGCSSSYTMTVTVKPVPIAAPTNDGPICAGGTVNLHANPGGSTTSYLWSGTFLSSSIVQDPTATPPSTVTYSLTVSSPGSGCSPATVYLTTVTVNPIPTAAPTTDGPICNGGTVHLFGNGIGTTSNYLWSGANLSSSTDVNPSATPTVTTTYTLTVTDGSGLAGCYTTYLVNVTVNPTPTAAPTNSGPICDGGTVTLNSNSSDATGWSWSGPGFSSAVSNPTATPSVTTTYSLTVSNGGASGCSPSTMYTTTVSVDATPTAAPTSDGPICTGGIVDLFANPGGSTNTYLWTGPFISSTTIPTPTAVPTTTSTYSLTVTNGTAGSGCSSSYAIVVTVNPTPTAAPTNDGPICAGGTVDLFANPGGSTTTYSWSGPALSLPLTATPTATPTTSATYSLTVTNGTGGSGCSTNYTMAVFVNPTPFASPSNSGPICDGGTVTLHANPGGSASGYTWSGPNLSSATDQNPTATPTVTTVYSVMVTSGAASGCSPSTVFTTTVVVNPTPTAAPDNDGPICVGGTVNLFAHPGGGTIVYAWSGPNLSSSTIPNPSATPTATVTYSLTVTNGSVASGCSSFYTTLVSVNPIPSSSNPTNDGPICTGGTANLFANTNSSTTGWTWTGSDGFSSALQDPVATPTVTTTYSLTVTGTGSGCTNPAVYTTVVSVNPIPSSSNPTNDGPICDGGTVNLFANSNSSTTSWAWSGPNLSSATDQNPTATPTVTTTYSLTVTGTGSGCTNPTVYTTLVSVNPVPTATPTEDGPICLGGTVNLSANAIDGVGTYIYTWSGPGITGSTSTATTTAVPTSTGSTVYSVTVTNTASGCSSGMAYTTSVSVNAVPSATPTGDGPICLGGTVNLTANATGGVGAYIYTWSGTGITGGTTGATTTAVPTSIGSTVYSVTVTNTASGCNSGTAYTTSVSVNAVPTATPTDDGPICLGGTVNLTANATGGVGAYIYTWSGTGITGSTGTATTTAVPTSVGSTVYSVTVTNAASGCNSGTAYTTSVSVNAVPSATPTDDGPICLGGTVNLTANATGGVGPYIYTWSGTGITGSTSTATTTAVPTSAGSTVYSVTVTNAASGCNSGTAYTTSVSVNAVPSATPTDDGPICLGGTVNLTANATGGVGPYIYTWSGTGITGSTSTATTTAVPTSAGSTVYSVTVTNAASGCNSGSAYTTSVSVNPVPSATPTNDGPICLGGTVNLTANATGGVGTYVYTWSGDGITGGTTGATTTAVPTATVTTIYSVTVTNTASGCNSGTAYVTSVSVNPVPSATPTNDGPICLDGTVNLTANATGGVGAYIYTWSGTGITGSTSTATTTAVPTSIGSTVYSVTVTNIASGCNSGMAYTTSVSVNAVPTATPTNDGPICLDGTVNLTANATGGVGAYTYSWSGTGITGSTSTATTTAVPTSIGSTVYSVTVTNIASGCSSGTPYTTSVSVNAVPSATPTNDGPICLDGTVTLVANATGGVPPYIYSWTGTNITGSTSTASTTAIPTVTGTTAYSVTVTNIASGCNSGASYTTTVSVNATPVAAPTNSGPICQGETVSLFANGGGSTTTYSWGGSNLSSATDANPTATPTVTSTYTLTVTNGTGGSGCSLTYTTIVSVNPVAPITGTFKLCGAGTTTTLSDAVTGGTWASSDLSIASIGSLSGLVTTGLSTGNPVIAYMTPAGCIVTQTLTVSPIPTAIRPLSPTRFNVCVGSTISLGGTPGGTWSSSAISLATVGSLSGIVTGVSAPGNPIISYVLPGVGCMVTTVVTVNAVPAGITGGSSVCINGTLNLSDATTGGRWSSGTLSVATVGSTSPTTATVWGDSVGTTIIIYSLPSGCAVSTIVTVNPNPVPIRNNSPICAGTSIRLLESAGGVWASSAPGIASIDGAGMMVGGPSSGNTTISYTFPTGCFATVTATVVTTPIAISGLDTVGVGHIITLSEPITGGTWVSSMPGVATIATAGPTSIKVYGATIGVTTISYTVACGVVTQNVSVLAHKGAIIITSVANPSFGSDIHVTPNPNKGIFTIKGSLGITDEEVSLEITDMLGQTVYKDKVAVKNGDIDQKIQLSKSLANGMYLLSLHTSVENKVFHIVVEQ